MKRLLILPFLVFCWTVAEGQSKPKEKKYPSLLWEISGPGLKKPSFLIGTMHVSSKLAFNLPDSFYYAIRNAQVVALETNPETWQEDMSKYDINEGEAGRYTDYYDSYRDVPEDYLSINTLKFYKYDSKIERALYSNPSTLNNLLYRSYGNESSDFEEDTYLDMYIFQYGKKWGKKLTGVENYGESMRLMAEAYKDAAKDKNRKDRSYDGDEEYSSAKLQEAYRTGNLDLLDTINKYNSVSEAFDEKFLYRRNEIQAASIDSILRSGASLFVGVGAAHLPGQRGVIEMLRRKGYRLRPVKMGERASREKDLVDKIRVPVVFKTTAAEDGLYKVDIPGTFYKFGDDAALDQRQYADMANGSYYMVTRIMTNAWMWSHKEEDVIRKIDSLLYENVPGKIITKTTITRNGYKGIDVLNRTRRGDLQRYNIFITPFEVLFFKMGGTGDYVKNGTEAQKFFGSIQLKEFKNTASGISYSPPYGGFSVDLPHEPYIGNDGSWIYDAADKNNGTNYRVIRTDIHNYHFVEEDSFDLGLMDESFMASDFITAQLSRKQTSCKGYPALDCKYKGRNGEIYIARFIIQGPHYYTLVAQGKQETAAMKNFLNSFAFKPFVYGNASLQKDTALYFTVTTPVFPEDKKIKLDIPRYSYYGSEEDEEETENDQLEAGAYRNKIISNDSTGEKIYVFFYRSPRYYYSKDSSILEKDNGEFLLKDSTWIIKWKKKSQLPDKTKVWEVIVTDTGSSRTLWTKSFYKEGISFTIATQSDTLTAPGEFTKQFFETFTPADTLKGVNPFVKKTALFFDDLMSRDSVVRKRAVKAISTMHFDSADLPGLKKAIHSLSWKEKKYLDTKKALIGKLGDIKTKEAADYLKELYFVLDDTIQLQYAVLENLLQQRRGYAYDIFKNIVVNEPPVLETGGTAIDWADYYRSPLLSRLGQHSYENGRFWDELSDTLQLTRTILPDLLPLLNLEDYKKSIMKLLGKMIDSNLVKPADYEMYFSKFLIEARQELRKQAIAEKKKAIEKAEESKLDKKIPSYYEPGADEGNDNLSLYATLLMPYWDKNPAVPSLLQQMLKSGDKEVKYQSMLLLLRNRKEFPDSLLTYFGSLDEYRYRLYTDLKKIKLAARFPALYHTHIHLGKSALLEEKTYDKPDSVIYLDRLAAGYKDKKGFIYFFKYKAKKDDPTWKLAAAGLIPENPGLFEFEDSSTPNYNSKNKYSFILNSLDKYKLTGFSDTKLKTEESLGIQLKKELKRILYTRRKSAKKFYEDENDSTNTAEEHID